MAISLADGIECLQIGSTCTSEAGPETHQIDGILHTAIQGFHPQFADLKETQLVLKQRVNALRKMKLLRVLSLLKQAVVPLAYVIGGRPCRMGTLPKIDDMFC